MTAHVAQYKKDVANDFAGLIQEYPIIGAINMEGLPAKQLQVMRERLRETCIIRMTKRRLLRVAFEQTKKDGIKELEPYLKGMPALLFTKENPFTLFSILKRNKSPAPAKPGQEAPRDIKIPAGPTPFVPGPIIGELGKFGLKTSVENGKVAIKEEKIVVKAGETINTELAGLLTRLQIHPMEVGLDLVAVYEEGEILTKEILDIDEEEYYNNLLTAIQEAVNLSVNAAIITPTTIELLVSVGGINARNLSVEAGIINADNADTILGKAQAAVLALASHLPEEALSEELQRTATPQTVEHTPTEKKSTEKKPDKPEDGESESATVAGLGALFG